ncbi:glycosyltransferase family 4 protein [Elongatibacter sediminis]|uniref:Glycosyltransferase family 4 protein n=1 Tax=Elongatibacter sediminis TaxID=3119006 RepID=A0AAW9REL0_9GAMM
MKKLLIIDPAESFGGAESYALSICDAAIDRGWSVEAAFNATKPLEAFRNGLSEMGAGIHHAALEMHDSNLRSIPAQVGMARHTTALLKRADPDVALVILPWPGYGLGMACALAALRIPSLIVFQLVPATKMKYRWPVRRLYRWTQKRKQAWVAVSEGNRSVLSESFGVSRSEIEVIHNGVAVPDAEGCDDFARDELRRNLLSEFNLPDDARIVLSVGRLEKRKGILDLVKAVPSVLQDVPQARFIWAGEGNLRKEVESEIAASGLGHHLLLLGHRTDVPALLDCCDLFLFPSHFEGFPFALLEALAHDAPYVASDSCGSTEIGASGEYGLHFKCGSKTDMADKIVQALKAQGEGVRKAGKGRERVRDFSIDTMKASTLRAIETLCP